MDFCDTLCCQCNAEGKYPVNPSGYHKFCLNEDHIPKNRSMINCTHCSEKVMVIMDQSNCLCSSCNKHYQRIPYSCTHGICAFCDPFICKNCTQEQCRKCYSLTNDLCLSCQYLYCITCARFKNQCKKCNTLSCVCEMGNVFCLRCEVAICNNCQNMCDKKIKFNCNHEGCNVCFQSLFCFSCADNPNKLPQEVTREEEKSKEISGQSPIRSQTVVSHYKQSAETLKSSQNISSRQIELLDPLSTMMMTAPVPNLITMEKCIRCKSNGRVFLKSCTHKFCSKCIVENCCFCSIKDLELQCESCGDMSLDNMVLICKHIQCMRCANKGVLCRKCNIFTCQKCLYSFPKVIEKLCKHKVCEACFDEEIESDDCSLCKFQDCPICRERGYEDALFICGHTGCRFCFVQELPCWKCVFTGKNITAEVNQLKKCFHCKGEWMCKLLMCGDYVCGRCIHKIDIAEFNYYCSQCCITKEKKCIDCKKICIWEVTGKYLHKICCNDFFCKFCLKKKSILRIDCKCS